MKDFIEKYKNWNPSKYAVLLLLLLPLLLFIIYGFKIDNDFWFLINTGDEILKNGFINIEPFTIHSGLAFVPQQWLTDIIFSLIYNVFNIKGLFVLVLICSLVITFILYKLSYLLSNDRKKALFISIIFSIFLIKTVITTRPQTFDIIIFSLELLLLESYIIKDNKKYLYFLPLLSLLLINLHGSMWLMFFVFMLPYYVEYVILKIKKKNEYRIEPLVITTILSVLIGLLNPYGIKSITYIFGSYGIREINLIVTEMRTIAINSEFMNYVIIFVILCSFYHNKGKNKIRHLLLTLGITYLALKHYRGLLFLCIIGALTISYNYKSYTDKQDIMVTSKDKIIYLLSGIIFIGIIFICTRLSAYVEIEEIADYLDSNATKDIKLFTEYDDGNYMEYRGYKCYIDGRAEVFLKTNNKKEDIFLEYAGLLYGKIDANVFLNKYQFDYLLVYDNLSLLNELKNNKEYILVLENNNRFLYKRLENE